MAMNLDQALESVFKSFWVIGAFGAVVALRGVPGLTWWGKLLHVGGGVLIAGFLTEGVAEYFSLDASALRNAVAFLLGMFGMNLLVVITQWLQAAKLSDVLPWRRKE